MSEPAFSPALLSRLRSCGVMPVIEVDEAANVIPLAKALLACGIDVMEITLRTESGLDAIRRLRDEIPKMLVGVGTLLEVGQVSKAQAAGAAFGVAPGFNPDVLHAARDASLPFAPGVITPSEVDAAIRLGCRELKLFPAEPAGGIHYLKTMLGPYQHLGLKYFVSGGVNVASLAGYLYWEPVIIVGGAWIATRKVIASQNWSAVIDHATEARAMAKDLKKFNK